MIQMQFLQLSFLISLALGRHIVDSCDNSERSYPRFLQFGAEFFSKCRISELYHNIFPKSSSLNSNVVSCFHSITVNFCLLLNPNSSKFSNLKFKCRNNLEDDTENFPSFFISLRKI